MLSQKVQNGIGYINKQTLKFPQEYKRNKLKPKITELFTVSGKQRQ